LSFNGTTQTTGANLQVAAEVSLPVAPPSPVTVTVTSNGPAIATISTSGTVVGGTTLTFTNVSSGGFLPTFYIQGQTVGTTTLTVSAPGYTSGTTTVNVNPSGFTFANIGGISTTTFSAPTNLNVYPSILNPSSLTFITTATLNPGLAPISVPVTSSNTVVGTITSSPLVFNPDITSQTTTFKPASAGTTSISIGTPAGFSTPSNDAQNTATVTAPALSFNGTTQTTGANLQVANFVNVPVAPPNALTVTVTSNDPTLVTLSKSTTAVGTPSLTFTNVTTSGAQTIYVQGQGVGSTTLTVSAPGYTNGTATITVYPSGFTFASQYSSGLSTTASSSASAITVYPSILNPGILTYYSTAQFNPGLGGTSVSVTSSNTGVGTITTSPLIFNGGEGSLQTTFKPVATGTATLNIVQPSGYSNPSQYITINATVQ
jgi:hypothetical protein